MSAQFFSSTVWLATAAGIASHNCIFIRKEWHVQAPVVFKAYLAICLGMLVIKGLQTCFLVVGCYCIGLFSSMILYRRCFHRLRNFPGPPLASVTKFWHVYKCLDSKNHLLLDRLSREYGPLVRTGPEEITVFFPEILPAIDGPGSRCTKAVWYDLLLPEIAVNTTRDKPMHDQRRRIWDHGFTTKALLQYEDRVLEYAKQLEEHVATASSKGIDVNVSQLFYFLAFDVMGDFAFGKSFGMLRDEKWHKAVIMCRRAMELLGPLSPVPWLCQIGFYTVPWFWVIRDWHAMLDWCRDQMGERIKMDTNRPDVSHWLIEASKKNDTMKEDRPWLNGDAVTIIIAGSDTVAPALVFMFYELALHPNQAEKLNVELQTTDISDRKALQALPHLNGFINECLRLHPPVPSGGYRETPPEGMTVAGHYIPGNTTIVAPRYSLGRLESCFEQADKFIPERWYSKPELIKDKRAFAPFAQGRYNCVGKGVALAELRFVTALLVSKYTISFAAGEDGRRVEADLKDHFTAGPGELRLMFKARSKSVIGADLQ